MVRLPARRALGVVALLAAAAVLSVLALDDLEFRHDSRSLLRANAGARRDHEDLVRRFGSEDILLVAWEVEDALDPAAFRELRAVTDELSGVPGLEEVYSLGSASVLLPIGPRGTLKPLEERDLIDPVRRALAREALREAAVYVGTLTSPALDVVAVAGTLAPGPPTARARTLDRVRAVAAAHERPDRPIHVAGVTALAVDAARAAVADLRTIGSLALVLALVLLFLVCGSLRETGIAVLVTGLPPVYALGLACALDLPITALGAALFPVLGVVGITTSIHLLHAYAEERAFGHDAQDAARRATLALAVPIVLSLLTTAAAFAALQATGVPAFVEGGRVVALGLLGAIPVVLLGLPSLLVLVRPRPREAGERWVHRVLARTCAFSLRHPVGVVAGAAVLGAVSVTIALDAPLRVDVLQAFRPESRIARTYRFLDERLTATLPVDVVVETPAGTDPARVIAELDRFGQTVLATGDVDSALSAATLVRYGRSISPVDPGDAGALLFLRSALPRILRRFEDADQRRYRVKLRVREGTTPEVLDRIEEAAARFTVGEARIQGLFVEAVRTTRALRSDLFRGIGVMGAGVALVALVALRSSRAGLAALLANVVPALLVFGGAGLVGLPLDVSAVAVGGVAVGLSVDDTLHLLWRYRRERRGGRPPGDAARLASTTVGRALLGSTAVLTAGLGALAFSAFLPTARFGLFAAAVTVLALLADLLLVPSLLAGSMRRGR